VRRHFVTKLYRKSFVILNRQLHQICRNLIAMKTKNETKITRQEVRTILTTFSTLKLRKKKRKKKNYGRQNADNKTFEGLCQRFVNE